MASKKQSGSVDRLTAGLLAAMLRIFSRIHIFVYRRTGGAIGGQIYGNRMLLLTTTGRTTGQQRTTPLAYLAAGDAMIIIAGAAGAAKHPAWWLNLVADPHATIQVGPRTLAVVARRAEGADHARLWPAVKKMNPFYGQYELITDRDIPVVILEPAR